MILIRKIHVNVNIHKFIKRLHLYLFPCNIGTILYRHNLNNIKNQSFDLIYKNLVNAQSILEVKYIYNSWKSKYILYLLHVTIFQLSRKLKKASNTRLFLVSFAVTCSSVSPNTIVSSISSGPIDRCVGNGIVNVPSRKQESSVTN